MIHLVVTKHRLIYKLQNRYQIENDFHYYQEINYLFEEKKRSVLYI